MGDRHRVKPRMDGAAFRRSAFQDHGNHIRIRRDACLLVDPLERGRRIRASESDLPLGGDGDLGVGGRRIGHVVVVGRVDDEEFPPAVAGRAAPPRPGDLEGYARFDAKLLVDAEAAVDRAHVEGVSPLVGFLRRGVIVRRTRHAPRRAPLGPAEAGAGFEVSVDRDPLRGRDHRRGAQAQNHCMFHVGLLIDVATRPANREPPTPHVARITFSLSQWVRGRQSIPHPSRAAASAAESGRAGSRRLDGSPGGRAERGAMKAVSARRGPRRFHRASTPRLVRRQLVSSRS